MPNDVDDSSWSDELHNRHTRHTVDSLIDTTTTILVTSALGPLGGGGEAELVDEVAAGGGGEIAQAVETNAQNTENDLFYLVDSDVAQYDKVAKALRDNGYNAESTFEHFESDLKDGPMTEMMNSEFNDMWRVITRDLDEMDTLNGWPSSKIVHLYGGNNVRRWRDVIDILVTKYHF